MTFQFQIVIFQQDFEVAGGKKNKKKKEKKETAEAPVTPPPTPTPIPTPKNNKAPAAPEPSKQSIAEEPKKSPKKMKVCLAQ